jgi:hypothetical protein
MYKIFVAALSLAAALNVIAAPIAIPFTGLSADLHMKRDSLFPVLEVRVSRTVSQV